MVVLGVEQHPSGGGKLLSQQVVNLILIRKQSGECGGDQFSHQRSLLQDVPVESFVVQRGLCLKNRAVMVTSLIQVIKQLDHIVAEQPFVNGRNMLS